MNTITIFYAALVLVCVEWFIALLWVIAMREAFREDKPQSIPRRESYIICGKGYHNQEDKITMTKSITPSAGALYVHLSGRVYKCLRVTTDGCPVMMDINDGTLLTVRGVYEYQDGKISYERCVESIRIGA